MNIHNNIHNIEVVKSSTYIYLVVRTTSSVCIVHTSSSTDTTLCFLLDFLDFKGGQKSRFE